MFKENDALRDELNSNENIITQLVETIPVLVAKAVPEEKTEVHHQLANVRDQWDNLEKALEKRKADLENVKALADEFNKDKDHVNDWLTQAEESLKDKKSKPNDIDDLKNKLRSLRAFQRDLAKHQKEITKLEQKGDSLSDKVNDEDSQKVHDTVEGITQRWENLLDKSYEQQHTLEDALLENGHFNFAMEELLVWINQTKESLLIEEEIPKDKKLIEVEQSKLKIITNHVEAHKPSVKNCQKAAQKLIDDKSAARPDLEAKLKQLNEGWDEIQELLKRRDDKLQTAFVDSENFQRSVRALIIWLSEAKIFLKTKRPYGGKLETVEEQYQKHQKFMQAVEEHEVTYKMIIETFEVLIQQSDVSSAREFQKSLNEIITAWTVVSKLSQDTSDTLEKALDDSRFLQNRMNEMEIWIVRVEGTVSVFTPVSTIFETITVQLTEIEEIYFEFAEKRDVMREIRKTVDTILEHCSPDEGHIINEEIVKLTEKWKTVSTTLKKRKKNLDENYDQSKIFFEGSEQLMTFMDEMESKINEDQTIGKDANSVKAQMRIHKDYQNQIGKKQSKLNAVVKTGKSLIDRSQPEDADIVQARIDDLCARWEVVCAISVERQHKLEEALLFHGMFQDALYALLEWLHSVEPGLTTETAVMGDPDTVKLLIDNHKVFQKELGKREKNFESIVSRGESMLAEGKVDNVKEITEYLDDLKIAWEIVGQMSVTKYERLQSAYTLGKDFQIACRGCVTNLGALEDKLKQQGLISDDVSGVKQQIEEFIVFEELLEIEEVKVNGCLRKGEVILRFCHPSSLQTIRHQVAVVKKRWNDVLGWARQRKSRLDEVLIEMIEEEQTAQVLMEWITEQEVILEDREKMPLPDNYDLLIQLLNEHKIMQVDAEKKQPDYGKITKNAKRKPLTDKQRKAMTPGRGPKPQREFANPMIGVLSQKWQNLWLNLMNRHRRIQDKLNAIRIEKAAADFSWPEWRDRYNTWLHDSKSRVLDMWRKKDNDKDNKLTRDQFIGGFVESAFPTEKWEVELVYDQHKRGVLITYQDFMDALKGRKRKPDKPQTESEQIDDIIKSEVAKCCCAKAFQMFQVAERKYRFGDAQKLRLVRILRSVVMVRVGGGWETLADFLDKNDPCRAEGRTNYELRENFIMPEQASQSMQAFKSKPAITREGSGGIPRIAREKSGNLQSQKSGNIQREKSGTVQRESINNGHGHPDYGTHLGAPSIRRGKSDLDREGKSIPTYKSEDYSNIRGSGYGTTYSTPKKKPSPPEAGVASSPVQPKITREKSDDVYSRLYGTSPKTTTTRTVTSRSSISSVSGTTSRSSTTRSSTSSTSKSPAARKGSSSSEKAAITQRSSVTTSDDVTTPVKGLTTKTRTGGVFERLTTSQEPATKKATETSEKKTPTKTRTKPKSAEPKKRTSAKKKESKNMDP